MAKQTKKIEPTNAVQNYDWSQSGVTGFEQVQKEDLGIPFLMIVQKGSPEVDKTHKDFETKRIDGAEVGDIVNTVARQVIYKMGEAPLEFVPCAFEKLFMEWKPREQGGGMVKAHKTANILAECVRNEKNQDVLRNGNLVVTTAYFSGMYIKDGERFPAIIGMTSTQLKKARLWLNMMMGIKLDGPKGKYTPPMFSHKYFLSTVGESNSKGSWVGWKIESGGMIKDPVLIADAIDNAKRSAQRPALPPPPEHEAEGDNVPFA